MNHQKTLKGHILNPAILLSCITVLIYICGNMNYLGYLDFFGIDESLFPLDFQQTLFHGFWMLCEIPLFIFLPSLIGLSIWLVLLLSKPASQLNTAIKDSFSNIKAIDRLISTFNSFLSTQPKYSFLANLGLGLLALTWLFLMFMLLQNIAFYSSEKFTQQLATKWNSTLSNFNPTKSDTQQMPKTLYVFTLKKKDKYFVEYGFIIRSSPVWVAIYTKHGVEIYPASTINMTTYKSFII